MSGMFRNLRITTLLAVSLAVLTIQGSEGYPYQWRDFFSYSETKSPAWGESSSNGGQHFPTSAISKDDRVETAITGEILLYGDSASEYKEKNGGSRIVEGTVEERARIDEDDDEDIEDNEDVEEAERDDEDENDNEDVEEAVKDDEDEAENATNPRVNETEDPIDRVIKQALKDDVFLTPEKWAETHADKLYDIRDEAGSSVKIQKTRSPSEVIGKRTQTGNSSTGDKIVFPDQLPNRVTNNLASVPPVPSCKGSTICDNPPYYPSDTEIQDALGKRYLDPVTEPPSISERIGPIDDDNGLCVSREQIIQPKSGLDDSKEWRFILNNRNYVQTVRVEVCQAKDEACQIIDDIASGYKTSCKQKYIYRQLVAFGPNGTASTPFQIPSSCCCHVKFDGNPLMRIGLSLGKRKQQTAASNSTRN